MGKDDEDRIECLQDVDLKMFIIAAVLVCYWKILSRKSYLMADAKFQSIDKFTKKLSIQNYKLAEGDLKSWHMHVVLPNVSILIHEKTRRRTQQWKQRFYSNEIIRNLCGSAKYLQYTSRTEREDWQRICSSLSLILAIFSMTASKWKSESILVVSCIGFSW